MASFLVLAAGEEKEVLLPGKRQDVRSLVGGGGAEAPHGGGEVGARPAEVEQPPREPHARATLLVPTRPRSV